MKESSKKVVVLNNLQSPYIREAILVLKNYNPRLESKVIADAEEIVNEYIKKTDINKQAYSKPASKGKKILFAVIAITILAVIAIKLLM